MTVGGGGDGVRKPDSRLFDRKRGEGAEIWGDGEGCGEEGG